MFLFMLSITSAASSDAELQAVYAQLTDELPELRELQGEPNMQNIDWSEGKHPFGGVDDSWDILSDILKPHVSSLDLIPSERPTIHVKTRCHKSACVKGLQSFGLCKIHLREAFRASRYSDALKRAKNGEAPQDPDGFQKKQKRSFTLSK